MALPPGTRIGPYQIDSALGAGGMGEVYRALDTRLDRHVAIKILPEAFAADAERIARFQREAKVLASLNHPNIAIIYGLEHADGAHALVMELVEGEDLAQRIVRGAMPFDEALPIAKQIADALEAAHEQGIIHRDLKPANIKVRPDGTVKVLDFGLARLAESGEAAPAGRNVTHSPTITSPGMTGTGMILGTAAYMSPEQARGKTVDKRADIWAFGVVVFEMLTGRRLFTGETISDTLASVLKTEPNWRTLPTATPTAVRRLLRRCLEKDQKRRLDSAADARLEIEEALTAPSATDGAAAHGAASGSAWARALTWISVVAALMFAIAWLAVWAPWRVVPPPHVTRTLITPSGPAALTINGAACKPALSPDGTQIVYVGNNGTQLFVRALDALEPVKIASGVNLRTPFFSPDGQWVGFVETNRIRKAAITGGAPIDVVFGDGPALGATWAPDDTIIFSTANLSTGLQRVSAARGVTQTPEVLTRPDHAQGEADHVWPELLPGGRVVLFTITSETGGRDTDQVVVRDLRTGEQKVLLPGASHAHYVASGHLVFFAAGTLRAIRFDLTRLETRGTAVQVLPRLATTLNTSDGCFDVATDGTLVYVDGSGNVAAEARTLVWVDRAGKETPIPAPPRAYDHPRLSPDGTRVVLSCRDQEQDLWIWDLVGHAGLTRLTLDPGQDWFPVWTTDSLRVIFISQRGGNGNLWWQAADGTGVAERLTTSDHGQFATGITPDRAVVFNEAMPNRQLLMVALDGTRPVTRLLETKYNERGGVVSPNGRWLAHDSDRSSDRSTVFQIYVTPFPNVNDGGAREVSTAGGTQPLWAPSGKELFYVGPDGALMKVPVEASGATFTHSTPIKLLEARYYTGPAGSSARTYDVSSDGQRFLMIKAPRPDAGAPPPAVIVVQHWDEELKRLVPAK